MGDDGAGIFDVGEKMTPPMGGSEPTNPFDYWRLCDRLSVIQAAHLVVNVDPAETGREGRPPGYDAAFAALTHAIIGKTLSAIIENTDWGYDWYHTTIAVDDLRAWLESRGIRGGFFFPIAELEPDYLSKSHPKYSAKLAAAIGAWEAVSSNPGPRGRSVKQALVVWLRQHANEYGLTKEDGNPNEQGIEEVAKIANWDMRGGAPKTPGD